MSQAASFGFGSVTVNDCLLPTTAPLALNVAFVGGCRPSKQGEPSKRAVGNCPDRPNEVWWLCPIAARHRATFKLQTRFT